VGQKPHLLMSRGREVNSIEPRERSSRPSRFKGEMSEEESWLRRE